MPKHRAIDVVIFPFTPETKRGPYEETTVLKDSLLHLGIWDSDFTVDSLVAEMDEAGVEKALMCSQAGGSWEVTAEYVRDFVDGRRDRLHGVAGIDPRDITSGVKKLETTVLEYGFVGAHSYPHWFGLSPDDRTYYPFYAKCCELDVPIQIQVGQAFQAGLRSVGRPEAIDAIAVDFPALKIIGIHTGYPWEREMVAVAWKHPNAYIGADCHYPQAWASELVEFMRNDGRDKVMWGTNKPVCEFQRSLDQFDELGLDEEAKRNVLYENVRRVYRLE